MRIWGAVFLLAATIAGVFYWKREPIYMGYLAGKLDASTLDARIDLLKPAMEVRLPEKGAPPYPVVLQFHGCAGVRPPFMHQWADIANEAGFAAVIVDSMKPRGLSRDQVCDGKALLGQERAGDVYAAIMAVSADPQLDAENIVLAGWSHGGWSIMDYLTFDTGRAPPPGITGETGPAPNPAGAVLIYPYCGPGALSRFKSWPDAPPVLALIAGADTVVDADLCIRFFENSKAHGKVVDITVYPDAEHVFDDPFLEREYIGWYNEAYLKDAEARYSAFLNAVVAQPAP